MTKIDDFLKAPYTRLVIPDADTGTFTAEVLEFPGCRAQADTAANAYAALNEAMREWLRVEIASGHTIPIPSITRGYSGHLALRIPRSIHKQAARMAEREGVSLNQFLVSSISAAVGAVNMYYDLSRRLRAGGRSRGSRHAPRGILPVSEGS